MKKLIFVAMPTKGAVDNGVIRPMVNEWLAKLHLEHPDHAFVAPMIQDYQLLAFMPQTTATWAAWGGHCKILIERCDEVWVMMLGGYDTSVGVKGEIEWANKHDKPVVMIST